MQGCLALSVQLGRRLDKGSSSPALPALVKATASLWAREGTKLCREIMGGNGILLDFSVAKAFADVEVRSRLQQALQHHCCCCYSHCYYCTTAAA